MIGLYVPGRIKQRHKGTVWGMYVREQARRRGLGAALLARLPRSVVEEVRLTVVTTNTSAIRLYQRAGFQPYGVERRALKVSELYHDEMLMTLSAAGLHGACCHKANRLARRAAPRPERFLLPVYMVRDCHKANRLARRAAPRPEPTRISVIPRSKNAGEAGEGRRQDKPTKARAMG